MKGLGYLLGISKKNIENKLNNLFTQRDNIVKQYINLFGCLDDSELTTFQIAKKAQLNTTIEKIENAIKYETNRKNKLIAFQNRLINRFN